MNDNYSAIEKENTDFPVLMNHSEILSAYHRMAEKATAAVMHFFDTEDDLLRLMEILRGQDDWRHVRAYLSAIDTFCGQASPSEKDILLRCLTGLLAHPNGTVRRMTAHTAGKLLASYSTAGNSLNSPKMSLVPAWKKFLHDILFPGKGYTERQRRWMGFTIKFVLRELLHDTADAEQRGILHAYSEYFKSTRWDSLTCLMLIDGISDLPFSLWTALQQNMITGFARHFFSGNNLEIQVASLRLFTNWLESGWQPPEQILLYLHQLPGTPGAPASVQYLTRRIRTLTGTLIAHNPSLAPLIADVSSRPAPLPLNIPSLILENERAETPWLYKFVNLQILHDRIREENQPEEIYTCAFHLLYMLQFSDTVVIREAAAAELTDTMPFLSEADRLTIAQELCKAIETASDTVSDAVPSCLGSVLYLLDKENRRDILLRLRRIASHSNEAVNLTLLETLGYILQNTPADYDPEELLGILCRGLVSDSPSTSGEAFFIIGHVLFDAPYLSSAQKSRFYSIIGRRMLCYLYTLPPDDSILYTASSIRVIDRFLQEQYVPTKMDKADSTRPVAFFPGTFDPFSLGHLAVAKEAVSLGFRVFIVLDESFWFKLPQPYELRRRMIEMSIAELRDCYLYPHPVSFRLHRAEDIEALSRRFPGHDLYIIQGDKKTGRIAVSPLSPDNREIQVLRLPAAYAKMSSSFIRDAVSRDQDIAGLVDEQVRRFILRRHLYAGEPLYRRKAATRKMQTLLLPFETPEDPFTVIIPPEEEHSLLITFPDHADSGTARENTPDTAGCTADEETDERNSYGPSDAGRNNPASGCTEADGCVRFHIEPSENEKWDRILPEEVNGDLLILHSVTGTVSGRFDNRLTALDEVLVRYEYYGCNYALMLNPDVEMQTLLAMSGFVPMPLSGGSERQDSECRKESSWWYVNLQKTLVLFSDTRSFVRAPYQEDPDVQAVIHKAHLRIRQTAARLYPGCLLLNFDSDILNGDLAEMIETINSRDMTDIEDLADSGEPAGHAATEDGGDFVCVPFGKILKGVRIPGVVTKELNTEKVYESDLSGFNIREYPGYAPLRSQIRTLRSFRRPVILVDDLYHKGYRMDKIRGIFREEGIPSEQLAVGILSGKGAELAGKKEIRVYCHYYIPHMTAWLLESDLYPFIGGDGISDDGSVPASAIPALPTINTILPYQMPHFLKGADREAFYDLSEHALKNARDILLAIEKKYQKIRHRRLTASRLGEVMTEPRCPIDTIAGRDAADVPVTDLISRELKKLRRLHG